MHEKHLEDGSWRAYASHGSGPSAIRASRTGQTRREARQKAKDALDKKLELSHLESPGL